MTTVKYFIWEIAIPLKSIQNDVLNFLYIILFETKKKKSSLLFLIIPVLHGWNDNYKNNNKIKLFNWITKIL